ncbi:hypothetical protein LCGC14_0990500 [marine sediment metagenome]|uniref:Class I SAM-dependent methyltransferase n=1 Tax=marine sediment metagenome TaxID=412755 RepID=A0A0F9QPC0_9ZZZZ
MRIHSNFPRPLLEQFRQQHQVNFFVETGTLHGDTAELAAMMFDQVWSCDINSRLIQLAKKRLKNYPNVSLSAEGSPDFLRRIKPELTQPTVYWLDAHWCGGPKPAKECCLIEELDAIGSFRVYGFDIDHSILLIDDVELMESPPPPPHDPTQWPTMVDIRAALDGWGEPYRFEYHQGPTSKILIVKPEL